MEFYGTVKAFGQYPTNDNPLLAKGLDVVGSPCDKHIQRGSAYKYRRAYRV